jgi:DNA/RNA-binding domain of Phe-tRNA-synthetase-like protein
LQEAILDNKLSFQYHTDILSTFPQVRAGVVLGQGLHNGSSPDDLQQAFIAEQKAVLAEIGDTPLSELPTLAAWRSAFRKFDVNPTKYRSAIEALLRRLTKKGDIPSINTLVDLGNLVSIRYRIPVAVFDTASLQSGITVHFADGSERFTPLFETQVEHPDVGEVIFSDDTKLVVARRWCWRQSDESAARPSTTDVIICTESQHEDAAVDIEGALQDLLHLLGQYAGGEYISGILDCNNAGLSV